MNTEESCICVYRRLYVARIKPRIDTTDKKTAFIVTWYHETGSYKSGKVDSATYHDINQVKDGKIIWYSRYKRPEK